MCYICLASFNFYKNAFVHYFGKRIVLLAKIKKKNTHKTTKQKWFNSYQEISLLFFHVDNGAGPG